MSGFDMYQTSGYKNPRNRKKTLVLDIKDGSSATELGSGTEFNVSLFEQLIIDQKSELYLDNFVTFNGMMADKVNRASFCLKINEFNMNTNCASNNSEQSLFNSIVIPNENRNVDNFFTSVSHKAKKFNYVCDVNPMTISSLSGKITDLDGNPIFHGDTNNGAYNTYALINITSPWQNTSGVTLANTLLTCVPVGTSFDLSVGGSSSVTCKTIALFNKNTSVLYFVPDSALGDVTTYNNKDNVQITFTNAHLVDATPKAGLDGGGNMVIRTNYPTLIRGGSRMVAEFSIVSRD